MGRHSAELEDAGAASDPAKASVRSRIWGNPVPMATIGLIVAIALVFGGWMVVGRGAGTSMVYPWTTDGPVPTDVSVTVIPTPVGAVSPSLSASPGSPRPGVSDSSPPQNSVMPSPTKVLGGGVLTVTYRVHNAWEGAFQGEFKVTNTGGRAIDTWLLRASFPSGLDIYGLWEARSCDEGVTNQLVAVSVRPLEAGQTIKVGFLATFAKGTAQPNPLTVAREPSGCPKA